MIKQRPGAALVEALVAAVLAAVVAAAGSSLMQAQSRVATDVSVRSERNDAARSALLTLHAELRDLAPRRDLKAVARDSIGLRVFRGVAVTCARTGEDIYMRYRGLRLPDPTKDSILQIGVENTATVERVTTQPGACAVEADEVVVALRTTARAPVGTMWLIFESGAYHLSTHALRYRRGNESRQPITNEVIDHRHSSFAAEPDSAVRAVHVVIQDRRSSALARRTVPLGNAQ